MNTASNQSSADIDFHYWPTPNGQKVAIFLEEAHVSYKVKPVDIGKGVQFTADFEKLSPNNRMPAIVDRQLGISVFESGAILLYLADKSRQFIPDNPHGRAEVLQWLFWQVAGLGPILGQTVFFQNYASEKQPLAIERFARESKRLYTVLNTRLADRDYIATGYSIADMATFPWVSQHTAQGISLDEFPHVAEWLDRVGTRPAVQRAYALGEAVRPSDLTDAHRKQLYGQGTKAA
ncbi:MULTISPECIES: glutathione S-transferase family protein [unclassified Caballeronia]|uniref:glutathione S-transferase family protein n=1 Tax=unclassified Caballeronia TaxID=2646786 RepID=UPI001F286097|nr:MULTISPECIES: glutathione S-transferase N-terminal domain-containing protein [unclassified Caballeronia]MCE4546011.1 glutathione S-transferase N-terminal domain-containing protein [Caballeronia sp. PC1]MCE4571867.1 glutathione S-transferase N-terminal domain-containing protein [Caballeronia sp. CLC5]MCE4573517.1 glutathione S-transferase N-terminal domain-containing protein [Caballeronia sp. CLC5]